MTVKLRRLKNSGSEIMKKESNKKQLGKGIRALLSSMDAEDEVDRKTLSKELSKTVAFIPMVWIEAKPFQPRKDFDTEAIESLAQSIKTHGIIQPLTLRRLSENNYQIIADSHNHWNGAAVQLSLTHDMSAVGNACYTNGI